VTGAPALTHTIVRGFAAATARHVLPAELVPDDGVAAARAYLQGLDAHGLLRLF